MNNREQFELWAKNQNSDLSVWARGVKSGTYKNPVVAKMWESWQAASKASEQQLAAVVAENSALKKIVDFVTDLDNEPEYHDAGMGCGLEDRGITDRYDACRYGWDEAMERIYGEVIPCAEEIETPATDAYLAEVRAQGVDVARNALITFVEGEVRPNTNVPGLILGAGICVSIAAQLRQGDAQ